MSWNGLDYSTTNKVMATSRLYDYLLQEHFVRNRQRAFVSGPRQVGKTTACRRLASAYVNWDDMDHRERVLAGPREVASAAGLYALRTEPPLVLFDELCKFGRWKQFLKGFFDTYGDRVRVVVAGSSRLDVYRREGDSLMGRYFSLPHASVFRSRDHCAGPSAGHRCPRAAADRGRRFRCAVSTWWLPGALPLPRIPLFAPLAIHARRTARARRCARAHGRSAARPARGHGALSHRALGRTASVGQSGAAGTRLRGHRSSLGRRPRRFAPGLPKVRRFGTFNVNSARLSRSKRRLRRAMWMRIASHRPVIRWWFRRARCSRSYSDWACRYGQGAGQACNGGLPAISAKSWSRMG